VEWKKYQSRKPTPEEIEEWFTGTGRNIAVICGAVSGNLVVIDFDEKKNYKKIFGTGMSKETLVVETARGYHVYFRTRFPVKSFKITQFGIDVKGEGGYVLFPPSKHPSGAEYRFDRQPISPKKIEGDFQEELFYWLKAKLKGFDANEFREEIDLNELLEGIGEGGRNEAAIRIATWYRKKKLKKEEAWEQLQKWNQRNTPPLDDQELQAVLNSAYERKEPYGYKFPEEFAEKEFFSNEIKKQAEELLQSPDLLEFIGSRALRDVIGNIKFKTTLYLINLVFNHAQVLGDTATGKSHTADRVMDCFPRHTWFKITGVTDKAIRYLGQNIKHMYLCEWGAVGRKGEESTAQYDVKILASEGRLKLLLVAKDEHGNLRTQWVETEVQNIISTSTSVSLPNELLNRFWELTTEIQTEAIVRHKLGEAEKLNGRVDCTSDRKVVRCATEMLEKNRPDFYVIPYARQLGKIFEELYERTRTTRDVDKLMSLINAISLLYSYQRAMIEGKKKRYLVCSPEDFYHAWKYGDEAILGTFVEMTQRGRDAYEKCQLLAKEGKLLTYSTLASLLNITPQAAGAWLRKFEQIGYVVLKDRRKRGKVYQLTEESPKDVIISISMSQIYKATEEWIEKNKVESLKAQILGNQNFREEEIIIRIPAFILSKSKLKRLPDALVGESDDKEVISWEEGMR